MALSAQRKALLATLDIPAEDEMRTRIRGFMLRSGLNAVDLSEMMGVCHQALYSFLKGTYDAHYQREANSLNLRAKAKEVMDLHDIELNFTFRHPLVETYDFKAVRTAALYALAEGKAYVVDGPPGTQKTECARRLEREINDSGKGRAVYVYARIGHTPQSFLIECCTAAGIPNRGTIDQLIRKLRFFLARGRTLLLIDEAQHLDTGSLGVLRQLIDLPPHFGVVVFGSHSLTQRLSHMQMEQWRSRTLKTLLMNGPSESEAAEILRSRLGRVSDAAVADTIRQCRSTAERVTVVDGKRVGNRFSYISARDLFGAIERVLKLSNPGPAAHIPSEESAA